MKCHYEVLEISRDADDTAIKAAYKKMALRCHPDKNMDRAEEAKHQFQLVQQAYEVLSDRQERAWYDSHREQILHSDCTRTEADINIFDVYPYFTTTCFRGYSDDKDGFYSVYRRVFENIAKEDFATVDINDKEDFLSVPSFGDSNSEYEDVVHSFYSYWMAYKTRISYSWLDERVPKDIRDRRIFKLIEKENKKVRAKTKKERNEEVRNLVQFVRKRDKRVQANAKRLQDRAEENRKKQEQISWERRSEQRRSNMAEEQAEWTKFDNVREQLEEIERHLGLTSSSEDGDVEDDCRDDDPFLCIVCNKLFKTQKSFENHEKSKKHRDNVDLLKDVLQEEDNLFANGCGEDLGDDNMNVIGRNKNRRKGPNSIELTVGDSNGQLVEEDEETIVVNNRLDLSSDDEGDHLKNTKCSKKNKKKRRNRNNKVLSPVEDLDDFQEVGNLNCQQQHSRDDEGNSMNESALNQSAQIKIKKKRRKFKSDIQASSDTGVVVDGDSCHICITCKNIFSSSNRLFAHLKKSGHARPLA